MRRDQAACRRNDSADTLFLPNCFGCFSSDNILLRNHAPCCSCCSIAPALAALPVPAPTRYPPADAGHLHRTHKSSEGDSDRKRDGSLQPSINQNQRGDDGGQRTADLINPVKKHVNNAGDFFFGASPAAGALALSTLASLFFGVSKFLRFGIFLMIALIAHA